MIISFKHTRYVISGNKLYLKGYYISSWSIDIMDITSVKRYYGLSWLAESSPKMLRIGYAKGSPYFASPVREQEFIDELKAINPGMYVNVTDKKGWWWRIWDWNI
ncbi:MAG: PH domain-containing protein [Tannerellaceae bacterium]|nr:PH domain-containing protein [Tannerellaceae bacterium]